MPGKLLARGQRLVGGLEGSWGGAVGCREIHPIAEDVEVVVLALRPRDHGVGIVPVIHIVDAVGDELVLRDGLEVGNKRLQHPQEFGL